MDLRRVCRQNRQVRHDYPFFPGVHSHGPVELSCWNSRGPEGEHLGLRARWKFSGRVIPSNSTFREYPTSQIGSATAPATLTMDGLGRVWVAEHLADKIGRLDAATRNMDEVT